MYAIEGALLPRAPWTAFCLDITLLYYDGPKLLLRRSTGGQIYLAWWSDADEDIERWIYLPIGEARLHHVLSGAVPSHQALSEPEDGFVYVVDVENSGVIRQTIFTEMAFIPVNAAPLPNARLNIQIPEELRRE